MDEQQVKPWWGNRVVFEYTFPKRIATECGHTRIGLVEPTLDEELQSIEGSKNMLDSAYRLDALCVATIDGRPVQQNGDETQKLIANHAKVRSLVNAARLRLCEPDEEERRGFLAGASLVAG